MPYRQPVMDFEYECSQDCLSDNASQCPNLANGGCPLLRPRNSFPDPKRPNDQEEEDRREASPSLTVEYTTNTVSSSSQRIIGAPPVVPCSSHDIVMQSTDNDDEEFRIGQPLDADGDVDLDHSSSPSTSSTSAAASAAAPSATLPETGLLPASTPDIAAKLFTILESNSHQNVMSWALPSRDRFVIHDAAEFTKKILPNVCRHANFSSFVRQLNKYDFHKVKNAGSNSNSSSSRTESIWTFKHINFRAGQPALLSKIKRKPTPAELAKLKNRAAHSESSPPPPALTPTKASLPSVTAKSSSRASDERSVEQLIRRLEEVEQSTEESIQSITNRLAEMEDSYSSSLATLTEEMNKMKRRMDHTLAAQREEARRMEERYVNQDLFIRKMMSQYIRPDAYMDDTPQAPPLDIDIENTYHLNSSRTAAEALLAMTSPTLTAIPSTGNAQVAVSMYPPPPPTYAETTGRDGAMYHHHHQGKSAFMR